MGASSWSYVTPWQAQEQRALEALREEVFARGAGYWRELGVASLAELDAGGVLEEEGGAHSVLDVRWVVRCEADTEGVGEVRVVEEAEAVELFGTPQPSREAVESALARAGDGWFPPFGRGSGCCTAVHEDGGRAVGLCFWGVTGD
ncbi:hypothetical protein ACIRST_25170 [Kitasatospora sp. NPDC101447]|uniref:hypothetical protein n=1 Tax=Kitasatospora sp. NPDC101447 TaxID=3364102 RepID=UPI0038264DDA